MLGMLFGVGAVIAMLSIGAGAERQALGMIEAMGLRNVLIHGRDFNEEEFREIRKKSPGLSLRDARAIEQAVPGVAAVLPRIELETYKVLSEQGNSKPRVFGVPSHYAAAANLWLAEGVFFDEMEESSHAQVCIIGSKVRQDLFGYERAIGRDIKVNDVWLTVIGILEPESSTEREFMGVEIESSTNQVLLPVTTARRKFDHDPLQDELNEIRVVLEKASSPVESALVIAELLDRLHGGSGDTTLTVPQALLEQSRQTQHLFNIVMGCIAGISLLVGGIGIMNIMLATILERTMEIGLRRAVGARRADIRGQFIIEAIAISMLGGTVGVGLGMGIAKGVAAYAGWTTVVTISSILLATLVSSAVGLVFGIYPAWRAANLDPIEALRHE
jgi:putative ABC transport system permease protein